MNRSRRSLLKAAGVTVGALAATSAAPRQAAAQWWRVWCGGGTGGGSTGDGSITCFLRGTRIRTDDGYRPIEQLGVGDQMAARFARVARIKFIESFTLERAVNGLAIAGR